MTQNGQGYGYDNYNRGARGGDAPRDERSTAEHDAARAKLVPEGRVKLKCIDAMLGKAGTGNHQIGASLEITEGEHKGTALPWYGSFTEKAVEYTVRGMRALGFEGDDITDLSSMTKGDEAIGVVEHTQDQEDGTWRARIAWVYPTGVAMKEKLEGAELLSFGKSMRGYLMRNGGSASGGGNTSRQLPPAGRNDERRDTRGGSAPRDDRGAPPPSDDDMPWNNRDRGQRR